MLDVVIKGGTVVDGTGADAVQADIGIRDGRIVTVGEVTDDATETIDASGLVVCPGFVDPHTHYDAQLFWDPRATPSNLFGVTSMIAGNCGFSLAPIGDESDGEYLKKMMVKVEGMALEALEEGVPWNWSSFGDYLDRVTDNGTAINVGFLVGHCALRRLVMKDDAVGKEATDDQVARMRHLLKESLEAGAIGFSTGRSFTHNDWDGNPVPSRWAAWEEVLELCRETSGHEGTTLEWVADGCLNGFSDDEVELMTKMSVEGQRPLNWNVLTIDSARPRRLPEPDRRMREGQRRRGPGGGTHHADPRRNEHEPRDLLRPAPASRMVDRLQPALPRADGAASRHPGRDLARESGRAPRGGGVLPSHRLGQLPGGRHLLERQ